MTNEHPTKIKICGITNLLDAEVAMEAGTDFLGFIFYSPSKRSIAKNDVRQLVSKLRTNPNCPILVGVFVNEPAADMARVLDYCDLDLAQLSGDETPNLVGEESSPIFNRSYKAIRPRTLTEALTEAEWYLPPETNPDRPSLLIDTYHNQQYGGIGQIGDWSVAAKLASDIPGLMLAGGLIPDNVEEAVRCVRPYAVDVASGVETTPGRKDHELVRTFISRAKSA